MVKSQATSRAGVLRRGAACLVDLGVAHELFDRILGVETVTSEDLHCVGTYL